MKAEKAKKINDILLLNIDDPVSPSMNCLDDILEAIEVSTGWAIDFEDEKIIEFLQDYERGVEINHQSDETGDRLLGLLQ